MRCENYKPSTLAYFLEARIAMVRCTDNATTEIAVNPPRNGNDGKVRVCSFCAKWDFDLFQSRSPICEVA